MLRLRLRYLGILIVTRVVVIKFSFYIALSSILILKWEIFFNLVIILVTFGSAFSPLVDRGQIRISSLINSGKAGAVLVIASNNVSLKRRGFVAQELISNGIYS